MKRNLGFGILSCVSLVAMLLGTTGCDTEAFCFSCGETTATGGNAGAGGVGMGGQGGEGGDIIIPAGAGGNGGNCGADILTDPQNCGACGNVCVVPNAFPTCTGGFCLVDTCAAGYVDLDMQVANGCEYKCTLSNGGMEICDSLDNDCNGQVDELTDLQTDQFNCGACNTVCVFTNATATCVAGQCTLDQCLVGYNDVNVDASDGCEYACTETNGGVEVCDYADNNCNVSVDEGFDLQTDAANCGTCGNNCSSLYPNAVGACMAAACSFAGCAVGYYNLDGIEANGCEYACTMTGAESCDGNDNDCNGIVDDGMLAGVGDPCGFSDVGECALGARACQGGALVCVGNIDPVAELCDTKDNNCDATTDEACPSVNATDIRLDTGANSAVGQATSTQLSVASLGDVVVAAYLDRRSGNADIRANVSTNGGTSWLAPDLGTGRGNLVQVEPSAFLSPTRAYVALAQFPTAAHRDVYIANAPSPSYNAYTVPIRVDKDATAADAFLIQGVVAQAGAAGNQDKLVVVWQSLSGTGSNVTTNVYLQRSSDGGATWLAQDLRINSVAGAAEQPVVATDGNGKAFIAWRDSRNGKAEVFAATYDANANMLGMNVAVSGGLPSEQITIAANAGGPNVYIAWTDLRGAKKAIRLARSTDSGTNYSADGSVVNVDSTFADASLPAIAATMQRVVLAWEDTRSGFPDIRVTTSLDAGATFPSISARADLGSTAGTSASTRPRVTLGTGQNVFVTWEDSRNGQRDIYANNSFDDGLNFQPNELRMDVGMTGAPSPLGAADSRTPFITTNAAGMRGIVVWNDYRTSTGTNGANGDIYANRFE